MSRFADPNATGRLVLPGSCGCPNQPHDEDYLVLRTQLGGLELAEFAQASGAERLQMLTKEWNLLDDDGSLAPLDEDHFRRMYSEVFQPLDEWLSEHLKVTALPNGSGAPSRNGSQGSASRRTRTTRKR